MIRAGVRVQPRFLDLLTAEIRAALKRAPDSGDLFALSCVSESLAARTLSELGLDAERLAEAVARVRSQSQTNAAHMIERTRQRKETALEAKQFELTRELREDERRLTRALRSHTKRGARGDPSTSQGPPRRHLGIARL